MTNEQLMFALDFTPEDLATNRHRLISEQQRTRLKRIRLEAMVLPVLLAWGFGAAAITSLPREPRQMLTFVATAVGCVFFVGMGVWRWWRLSEDLRIGKVAVVRGTVSVSTGESRNVGYVGLGSRLRINGLAFTIPFDAGSAFAAHVQYIIYYLPKSQIVVAAERAHH